MISVYKFSFERLRIKKINFGLKFQILRKLIKSCQVPSLLFWNSRDLLQASLNRGWRKRILVFEVNFKHENQPAAYIICEWSNICQDSWYQTYKEGRVPLFSSIHSSIPLFGCPGLQKLPRFWNLISWRIRNIRKIISVR